MKSTRKPVHRERELKLRALLLSTKLRLEEAKALAQTAEEETTTEAFFRGVASASQSVVNRLEQILG